jgi:hypothetical protein
MPKKDKSVKPAEPVKKEVPKFIQDIIKDLPNLKLNFINYK